MGCLTASGRICDSQSQSYEFKPHVGCRGTKRGGGKEEEDEGEGGGGGEEEVVEVVVEVALIGEFDLLLVEHF